MPVPSPQPGHPTARSAPGWPWTSRKRARPGVPPAAVGPAVRPPRHLADLDPAERRAAAEQLGEQGFRADQLSRHYFARLTDDPGDMTDVPAAGAGRWSRRCCRRCSPPSASCSCDQGQTRKTLWRAVDGAYVESVLMRYPGRVTMCVSSQAGCGMACPFCATGQAGLTRNLSAAEIVTQVVAGARTLARGRGARWAGPGLQHRVHGHGRAAGQLRPGAGRGAADHRPGAGRAGHLPAGRHRVHRGAGAGHRRLAAEGLPVRLAVSLHAPDDALRDELVPVNQAVEGRRGAGRGLGVRRRHRAPGVDRVRADP